MNLKMCREQCGAWDDELGCIDDYPDECPVADECKKLEEEEEDE